MTTPDGPDSASERGRAMHPHERFRTAIDHREPDGFRSTSAAWLPASAPAPARPSRRISVSTEPDEIADRVQQLAIPHPAVLERLHVDSRYLYLRASRDWQDVELTEDTYRDEFGIVRQAAIRPDGHLLYYDFIGHPLSEARTVEELARYPWPDPHDPARYAGLEEAGKAIRDADKALGVNIIASLFEFSWYLRGYVDFLPGPDDEPQAGRGPARRHARVPEGARR